MNTKNYGLIFILLLIMQDNICQQDFGFIVLRSEPTGAAVFIDDQETGRITPFQQQLKAGRHTYKIVPGDELFYSKSDSFTILKNQTLTRTVTLRPNYGSLYVQSNPSEANVAVDGKSTGKQTPVRFEMIRSGRHKISLTRENYDPLDADITIDDERTTDVIYDLAAGFGTIGIWVEPDVAGIYVDGNLMATGFYSGSVASGRHIIETRLDKHYSQSQDVVIINGDEFRTKFHLLPVQGNISVMVEPPESEITLDGKNAGTSPKMLPNLLVGIHEIILSKKGYTTVKKTIEVKENQTVMLNETLECGRPVKISASCTGAEIIFDGINKGITPVELIAADGIHQLKLRKRFYADNISEITVSPQHTTFLFSMERKTSMLSCKTNTKHAGYQLILDDPDYRNIVNRGPSTGLYTGKIPDTLRVVEGQYQLTISKKGYKPQEESLEIRGDKADLVYLLEPEKFRTKTNALVLSALWPGAGQTYLKRGSPHFLMGAVAYGLAGYAIERYVHALHIEDDYLLVQENTELANQLANQFNTSMQMSVYLQIGAWAVWGINMVWTFLMPSEKAAYNKMKLQAVVYPDSRSIGLGLTAGF